MTDIFLSFAGQAIYSLALLIAGYLWNEASKTRKDSKLVKEGVCSLLRDRIIHKYDKCMEAGYCSVNYLTDIEGMVATYTALGGNGIIPDLVAKIKALPTEPRGINHD